MKTVLRLLVFAAFAADLLAGCGSASSTPAAPTPVTGIATPQAVSVVTAN